NVPVATTLMGKGVFPEAHRLSVGMTGIWGTRAANKTTHDADVILAIGTNFAEADCSSWDPSHTFAIPPSKLIQIDIEPQEIGKIYPIEIGIVGDAKLSLCALIRAFEASGKSVEACPCRDPNLERRKNDWADEVARTQSDSGRPIHPARLLLEI